jgi:DNA-binding beta-propeller fold protein YncE
VVRRAGAALALLTAVACGTSGPTHLRRSPEPARAPVAVDPDGQVLVLDADDPEGLVVVGNRVLVAVRRPGALLSVSLDLRGTRAFALPGAARHLQVGDGHLLVTAEDIDALLVVDPATGSVLSRTAVGDHPHDAVQAGGVVVVAEEDANAIGFVRDGALLGRVTGVDHPGGIAADGQRAAAVEVRGRVLTVVDVPARKVVAKVPVGAGPTHVVSLGGGRVAVADTTGDEVLVVRISGRPEVLSRLHLTGHPYGLAFDADRGVLWAATGADDVLHRLALDGDELVVGATWRTVQQPNSLAVVPGTGAVVVAGATNPGRLQVITP